MNIKEAALHMNVQNRRLGIDTKIVKECEDLDLVSEWLYEVQLDCNYLEDIIDKGVNTKSTIQARFLQKVLLEQLYQRKDELRDLYRQIYYHFKENYPDEFCKFTTVS